MRKEFSLSGLTALCCALFSISAVPLTATSKMTEIAANDQHMTQTDLKSDPKMVQGVLPNGLHYYIRPNAEPTGRISLRLRANVGSLSESEEERGLSHFLEHMVFAGSTNFGIDEVIPTIQRHGLMFGRDVNAYTSFDETVYMIDLPNKDEGTVDMSMKLMRDFGDGAKFESARLDRERGVILNELKTRDSADYRVMKQELGFLLDGCNLVNRLPIGLESVIMDTPRDKFVDYYRKHYAADQLAFVIVGDITEQEGKELVEKYWGSAQPSGLKNRPDRGTLKVATQIQAKIIEEPESPLTNISISNITPFIERPDTVENRVRDLPLELATTMLNRRLEILKKKETCPFLRAGGSATDILRSARQVAIGASCSPEKWKPTLDIIEQELRRATIYGFTDDEFEEAKQKMIQVADVAVETWNTRYSDDIADTIIQCIGDNKVFTDPEEDRNILLPALEKLNAEICSQALTTEWNPEHAQILVTGTVNIAGGEPELLAAYTSSSQTEVAPPAVREVTTFAYENVGEPGSIVKKVEIDDLGIVQLVLSNNVRVNYKKTDFQDNTILMTIRVDGGKITLPEGKTGLDKYAQAMIDEGGLQAHDNDDLERLMAGKNVRVSFNMGEDYFAFNGATNSRDLEIQLKLFCAYLNHTGYRREADVPFKRSLPALFERMSRDSSGVLQMNMGTLLTGRDYRFAFPTEKELESYTIEDVKAWVDGPLKKNAVELNIIGDLEPSQLEALLKETLAAIPEREKDKKTVSADKLEVNFQSFGTEHVLTYPTNLDKSMTSVVWKSFDARDKERMLRLGLLTHILNNRLFEEIRDKMSDAYSPKGRLDASEYYSDYGFFTAFSPGTAENTERVGKAILELGDNLAKGTITQDEMDRIKKPLLATLEKAQRENDYWLNSALCDSQYKPDKLERFRSQRNDVSATTIDDLNALAKEIFPSSNAMLIRVVPQDKPDKEEDTESEETPGAMPASVKSNLVDVPEDGYAVLISEKTAADPGWKAVADKLLEAYQGKPFF